MEITRNESFQELENRAVDAERKLETIKTIGQVVFGEKVHVDNQRMTNAPLCQVGTKPTVVD